MRSNLDNPLLSQLQHKLQLIYRAYRAGIYGHRRDEVHSLRILEKLGSGTASADLKRSHLSQTVAEIEAISAGGKTVRLPMDRQEMTQLRVFLRGILRLSKNAPGLAREQAAISTAAAFEVFIADLLRSFFQAKPDSLKSSRATLTDQQLVDAAAAGTVLEDLQEARIRKLMYGSLKRWYSFLQEDLGFNIVAPHRLSECFLVRNCLLHSDRQVSQELSDTVGGRRYQRVGRQLNVTEADLTAYMNNAYEAAADLSREYEVKT